MVTGDRRTVPSTAVDRLFVYGTLRTGQSARAIVAPFVKSTLPAAALGTLYALPAGYPALVADDAGPIAGELLFLGDLAAALPVFDHYEGEDFVRILAEVTTAAGPTWAWLYAIASPELARTGIRIDDGDWVAWCATHPPAT